MEINFNKNADGLVPAIIQDVYTKNVLMLGYMNKASYDRTVESGKVTFYSRSKKRLWTKGEESGNFLILKDMSIDCDNDTLLVSVEPKGPTCHKGTGTCWNTENSAGIQFLANLEKVIADRQLNVSGEKSYVASLFEKGINKIAQKVGEEAVETVIEAKDTNDTLFLEESADLLFHYLILLRAKGKSLVDVTDVLEQRHK